jgi:hypothetical protein
MGPRGVSRLLQQLLPTPGTTQCSNAAHVSYRVSTTLRSLTVLQSSSSCYIGTQQAHPTACPLVSDMLVSDSAAAATSAGQLVQAAARWLLGPGKQQRQQLHQQQQGRSSTANNTMLSPRAAVVVTHAVTACPSGTCGASTSSMPSVQHSRCERGMTCA